MKKLLSALVLLVVPILCLAGTVKYNGYLANEAGLTYAKTYPLPMNQIQADNVSFQLTWSTAAPASITFTDGSESTATIKVSSSPVAGIAGETVCIANACLTDGVNWTHDSLGFSSGTALSIAQAINASSLLNTIVIATVPTNGTIIYTTSTANGSNTNYALFSSSQNALTISPFTSSGPVTAIGAMYGGTNSAYTLVGGSATVITANNSFSPANQTGMVGYQVLFTTSSGTGISGLTWGTTYYVIPISPVAFGLATTSLRAQAGQFIVLTSSVNKSTADSFVLTALPEIGTASGILQASNDGVNYCPYPGQGVYTFTAVFPSSTTVVDLGAAGYSWIRFNVNSPPTQGGLGLQIIPNAKNSGL